MDKRKGAKFIKIDFKNREETVIQNFYDGEGALSARMFLDGDNRILYGTLAPGASIGLHRHTDNCEIIYILEGEGRALYDGAEEELRAGDCHYCPRGHSHSLINSGDGNLVFFAAVPRQ